MYFDLSALSNIYIYIYMYFVLLKSANHKEGWYTGISHDGLFYTLLTYRKCQSHITTGN